MENQDLDLIGQTAGNMPYKIGIVDEKGNLKSQFVAKASTNRIDIPQSSLGTSSGGGGVPQLSSIINLFNGSAGGNVFLAGPSANYDNIQDGLLITLSNLGSGASGGSFGSLRVDLSSVGLKQIKIPKEKLVVNGSFDISDQLSQYIGKNVNLQYKPDFPRNSDWSSLTSDVTVNGVMFDYSKIVGFGGATIKVLPNTTLGINIIAQVEVVGHGGGSQYDNKYDLPILVSQVNDYKN